MIGEEEENLGEFEENGEMSSLESCKEEKEDRERPLIWVKMIPDLKESSFCWQEQSEGILPWV